MDAEAKTLKLPDECDYNLKSDELIAASAINRYLKNLGREAAKRLLRCALEADSAHEEEFECPPSGLSVLIDTAISEAEDMFEEELRNCSGRMSREAIAIRKESIDRLRLIVGQQVVETISIGFVEYIVDCYRATEN